MNTAQIAKAAGIAPRTKRYAALDADGFPLFFDGEVDRWEQVLHGIRTARIDRQAVDMQTYITVVAVLKAMNTARINVFLARRIREQYTPYQLCALVARITRDAGDGATIGYLADEWINQHAEEL